MYTYNCSVTILQPTLGDIIPLIMILKCKESRLNNSFFGETIVFPLVSSDYRPYHKLAFTHNISPLYTIDL